MYRSRLSRRAHVKRLNAALASLKHHARKEAIREGRRVIRSHARRQVRRLLGF